MFTIIFYLGLTDFGIDRKFRAFGIRCGIFTLHIAFYDLVAVVAKKLKEPVI